jgi:hypothetical protein
MKIVLYAVPAFAPQPASLSPEPMREGSAGLLSVSAANGVKAKHTPTANVQPRYFMGIESTYAPPKSALYTINTSDCTAETASGYICHKAIGVIKNIKQSRT